MGDTLRFEVPHCVLANSCVLKSCTFAAAAQHSESKTSDGTLLVVAMAHSVLATSCASKSCTFAAAARHGESKTSGMTLLIVAMAPACWRGLWPTACWRTLAR